jgi:hypothetical protein
MRNGMQVFKGITFKGYIYTKRRRKGEKSEISLAKIKDFDAFWSVYSLNVGSSLEVLPGPGAPFFVYLAFEVRTV